MTDWFPWFSVFGWKYISGYWQKFTPFETNFNNLWFRAGCAALRSNRSWCLREKGVIIWITSYQIYQMYVFFPLSPAYWTWTELKLITTNWNWYENDGPYQVGTKFAIWLSLTCNHIRTILAGLLSDQG